MYLVHIIVIQPHTFSVQVGFVSGPEVLSSSGGNNCLQVVVDVTSALVGIFSAGSYVLV